VMMPQFGGRAFGALPNCDIMKYNFLFKLASTVHNLNIKVLSTTAKTNNPLFFSSSQFITATVSSCTYRIPQMMTQEFQKWRRSFAAYDQGKLNNCKIEKIIVYPRISIHPWRSCEGNWWWWTGGNKTHLSIRNGHSGTHNISILLL